MVVVGQPPRSDPFTSHAPVFVFGGRARAETARVTSITPDGEVTVLADSYQGKKLNSPNDLWVDPRRGVYFTDPCYGSQDDWQLSEFHVYYISPDRKELARVLDDLVKPNGVVGTADGKRLYVADARDSKTYVIGLNRTDR